jgi:ribosomal protein S18 acetylase RimI-like enzyme
MEFNIREGTVDDWKGIDRVNRAVLPENYDESVYHSVLSSPTTICFVVTKIEATDENNVPHQDELDNFDDFDDELDEGFETKDMSEIVGYVIMIIQFDSFKRLSAHIFSIGILDEYRRKGLGSRLIDESEKVLRNKFQAVRSLTLHVRKTNKSAHKFYCRHDFSRAKVVKKYYSNEDAYLMKKMLN